MRNLSQISRFLDLTSQGLIVVFTLIGVGSVAWGIVSRTLGISQSWTEELARYSMVWVIYLGAAVAMARSAHIRVEMLQPVLPSRWWGRLDQLQKIISFGFLALITVIGLGLVRQLETLGQTSPLLGIPMYLMYVSVPVSSGLMALHILRNLFEQPSSSAADVNAL